MSVSDVNLFIVSVSGVKLLIVSVSGINLFIISVSDVNMFIVSVSGVNLFIVSCLVSPCSVCQCPVRVSCSLCQWLFLVFVSFTSFFGIALFLAENGAKSPLQNI